MEDRAQKQLGAIQGAGFKEAQIVRFPNSTYFSISVGKFKSRKDADALKKRLENNGIDAFVRAVQ
jgi:cell division septation protein DedD